MAFIADISQNYAGIAEYPVHARPPQRRFFEAQAKFFLRKT